MYTADNIYKMIKFLIDNIFFSVWGMYSLSVNRNSDGNELCSITC